MRELELCYHEQTITVIYKNETLGTIRWKINPYHSQNNYLDMDFVSLDFAEARELFEEISLTLKKSLQVMLPSEEKTKIAFLESAGFTCKRKCYEIEAKKQDYIGENCESEISYSFVGQEIYNQCCETMLDRYCLLHKDINPWTGSRDEFFEELPECVAYTCTDGEVSNFAFIESGEIAYVYGTDIREFRLFSQGLVTELFKEHEVITFEADDCDVMAIELKRLFINQSEESFNTYIFGGINYAIQ